MEKRFDETLKETSQHYAEALTRLLEGEKKSVGRELYVCDLEDLLGLECSGLSGLSSVGVELVDKKTKERICYIASSAWVNSEWDELTITVDVDRLPKEE